MEGRLLRVELHCHTEFSFDGHIGYDALLATAAKRRLDVIAITDHDTVIGALDYQQRLAQKGAALRIIVGEERTLADGSHMIGLFLREPLLGDTIPAVCEEIAAQGGICVVPHPYRKVSGALRKQARELPALCFEIFNPTCSHEENRLAQQLEQHGWIPVGGSDAHYRGDLGHCINLVPMNRTPGTPEDSVRQALLGRAPLSVLGIRQRAGDGARRYAPAVCRSMVPLRLRPAAVKIFHLLLDRLDRGQPELEVKHARRSVFDR